MDDSEQPTIVTDDAATQGGQPHTPDDLPPTIGRYRIDRKLGQGGMGTVYAAWDPELDRAVAVKLVRSRRRDSGGQAIARLQREAQAMAAVVHPNVVNVFEVGAHDHGVYIAMELVEGPTLRAWLQGDPRPWRIVLDVFLQAGHGLAAAHRRGLVHRDFKPTNVLVGNDGRARVLDFGLARAGPSWDSASRVAEVDADAFEEALTVPGAVMGTPAYMAPEQFEGKTVTAASDQFSFCVALWEGLVGKRPFAGDTFRELAVAVTRGRRRSVPSPAPVPAALLRIVERGLANDPGERWPTMDDLLDALQRWVRPRRRWWWAAAAMVGGTALAIWAALPNANTSCADEPSPWSPAERVAVEQSMLAAGGEDLWASTLDSADAFAAAWATVRRDLCEGGPAAGSQQAFDRRMACLQRARAQFDAVLELLGREDADVTAHAPELVAGLPNVEDCRTLDIASPAAAVPDDPDAAEAVSRIREQLARAQALTDAAAYDEGVALVDTALADATALDFAPALAEATVRKGVLLSRLSAPEAEATLEHAFWIAADVAHDEVAMEASIELAWLVGYVHARVDEGLAWSRHAEAAMHRLDRDPSRTLSAVLGPIHYQAGHWDEARVHLERELALDEERYGVAGYQTAMSRMNLANLDLLRGDLERACKTFARAATDLQAAFPDGHTGLAIALVNAGGCELEAKRYDESEQFYLRGVAVYEAVLGPDHPETADARESLGNLYSVQGRHELAMETLQRAAASIDHAAPEAHLSLRATMAAATQRAGDVAGAERLYRPLVDEIEATLGTDHELAGFVHDALGAIDAEAGRHEAAKRHYERAHEIDVARHGAQHPAALESAATLAKIVAQQAP